MLYSYGLLNRRESGSRKANLDIVYCRQSMKQTATRIFRNSLVVFILITLLGASMAGCGPTAEELEAVDYQPLAGDDWALSTPADEGLDPLLVADMYYRAAELETIESLLVIKNGKLIAEDYFNEGSVDRLGNVQSVTKSYTSALVGLALAEGCLTSLDQKMIDFFPELVDDIRDPRKKEINIRQMLQMRAGYPWEESTEELFAQLFEGFRPSTLVEVPLVSDPGTQMEYSNLTPHLLGIIVARACETDLKTFAEQNLLAALDTEMGFWRQDWESYYLGFAEMHLRPRDLAKFGLMVLDNGVYQGQQILPADWIDESLQIYSEDAWPFRVGRNFQDIGYGYQWWSIRAGDHRYNLAWGHGGQQIAVLEDLDMVIVATADPLYGQHGDEPWKFEKANLNLVADFIETLPSE
jgi:CubicO group peptidase (beta-lactamase class C family)